MTTQVIFSSCAYDGSAFRHIGDPMLELESVRISSRKIEHHCRSDALIKQRKNVRGGGEYRATGQVRLAFNEASVLPDPTEGNDDELRNAAIANARLWARARVRLILRNAYSHKPADVVQNIPEVCAIFCATANPVEVIVARTEQGRGVMGVMTAVRRGDRRSGGDQRAERVLRKIGYNDKNKGVAGSTGTRL